MIETAVDSFIVRLVQETQPEAGARANLSYGLIRHVQSDRQLRFTRMEEALSFIADFVEFPAAPAESLVDGADEEVKI